MVSRFVERAKERGQAPLAVTLILRSASSGPARALIYKKDELTGAGISAKAILAKLEPADELRELFASLTELAPKEKASDLIRWARNPRLLDAHEQATYGNAMCWSGDPMRRDADKRNALALFDDAASDRVRLGRLAFAALWSASSPCAGTAPARSQDIKALGCLSGVARRARHGASPEPSGLAARQALAEQPSPDLPVGASYSCFPLT